MKHIITHAEDGVIRMAVVDEATGELNQFGQLSWPEGYGLHESAVLTTNLTSFLGIDKTSTPVNGNGSIAPKAVESPPKAALPKGETDRERKNRLAREKYRRDHPKKTSRAEATSIAMRGINGKGGTERYIPLEEVVEIINAHPEGIRVPGIADVIWAREGREGPTPKWMTMGVANRLLSARNNFKTKGTPLAFATQSRKNTGVGQAMAMFYLPLR